METADEEVREILDSIMKASKDADWLHLVAGLAFPEEKKLGAHLCAILTSIVSGKAIWVERWRVGGSELVGLEVRPKDPCEVLDGHDGCHAAKEDQRREGLADSCPGHGDEGEEPQAEHVPWYTQRDPSLCTTRVCELEEKQWCVDRHRSGTSHASHCWNPCDEVGSYGLAVDLNSCDLCFETPMPTPAPTSPPTPAPTATACVDGTSRAHHIKFWRPHHWRPRTPDGAAHGSGK